MKAPSGKHLKRKKPGRPATGHDPVAAVRLSAEMRKSIDGWVLKQREKLGRSEAIRRLIEIGLKAK